MENYRCCGHAYCPFECGETYKSISLLSLLFIYSCLYRDCPYFCLCLEVFFCFWCSVFGNRFLIQSEYQVRVSSESKK